MSGASAAQALEAQFESIRRSEFTRLRKKVASLSPEHVAEVDAITASVVHAIARWPAAALGGEVAPVLVQAVVDLFHVAPVAPDPSAASPAPASDRASIR